MATHDASSRSCLRMGTKAQCWPKKRSGAWHGSSGSRGKLERRPRWDAWPPGKNRRANTGSSYMDDCAASAHACPTAAASNVRNASAAGPRPNSRVKMPWLKLVALLAEPVREALHRTEPVVIGFGDPQAIGSPFQLDLHDLAVAVHRLDEAAVDHGASMRLQEDRRVGRLQELF